MGASVSGAKPVPSSKVSVMFGIASSICRHASLANPPARGVKRGWLAKNGIRNGRATSRQSCAIGLAPSRRKPNSGGGGGHGEGRWFRAGKAKRGRTRPTPGSALGKRGRSWNAGGDVFDDRGGGEDQRSAA